MWCPTCRRTAWQLHYEPLSLHHVVYCIYSPLPALFAAAPAPLPLGASFGSLRAAYLPYWYARMLCLSAALTALLHCSLLAPAPPTWPAAALTLLGCLALLQLCLPRRVVAERVEASAQAGLACSQLHEDGAITPRPALPPSAIAAILLNEGFQHCQVRYYLAATVRRRRGSRAGPEEANGVTDTLFLPLLATQPRLPILTAMLAGLSRVLCPALNLK